VTSFWAEHAWLPTGLARSVRMVVSDGRFLSVEARAQRQPEDERLRGVVLPGLANAHSHVFQRSLRGRTQSSADNVLTWRTLMYEVADRLNPELYLALARATFAEMALAGFTVVGEYHYLHHGPGGTRYADPNAMGDALVKAAGEVGVRLTLLDTLYLRGGLTSEGHLPIEGAQARFADASVEEWADRMSRIGQTEVLRRGAAIHSIRAVPREETSRAVAFVGDQPLHVYLSEQPAENLACEMYYGCSPARLLADVGVLGPESTAVHATHVSDSDIALLAEAQSQVVVCPTSEADMADGMAPVHRLIDAGVPVAIGSDQHAIVDPFVELRELEMHERLRTGERGQVPTGELVRVGSINGYQSLGWYDGGSLAAGMLADFVTVDQDSVRTAGSKAAEIVYTATAADVLGVWVGGRPIVTNGVHSFGPVGPLLREAFHLIREAAAG
jgi:formiminoglutamate deiminase